MDVLLSEKAYLQGIIRASANENPKSYGHLNYLYTELFGKKLTGVNAGRRASGTTAKTTSPSRQSGSIVGTYQCKHKGQMAYMRIYRNGVFSLKLELRRGLHKVSVKKTLAPLKLSTAMRLHLRTV